MIDQITAQLRWQQQLEKKEKKIKKKDVEKTLIPLIKNEKVADGYYITATNYLGNEVLLRCATREECLRNLAIINGFTVE